VTESDRLNTRDVFIDAGAEPLMASDEIESLLTDRARYTVPITVRAVQPERVTEVDGVAAGVPVEVQPTRDAYWVFLGESAVRSAFSVFLTAK
jgi:hypothetical protein